MIGKISRTLFLLFSFLFLTIHFVQVEIFNQHPASKLVQEALQMQSGIALVLLILLVIYFTFIVYKGKIRFILQLAGIYGLYLIFTYLLIWSQNFNNKKFDIWDFEANGFFQDRIWPFILFLALGSIICHYVVKLPAIQRQLLPWSRTPVRILTSRFYLSQVVTMLILAYPKSVSILMNTSWLKGYLYNTDYLWLSAQFIALSWSLVSLMSYWLVKACSSIKYNRSSYSLAFATSLLFAFVFNFAIQYTIAEPIELLGFYLFQGAQAFQILVFTLLIFAFYLLINRYVLATLIVATSGTMFILANDLKFSLRNEPILPSDLVWLVNPSTLFSFVDVKYLLIAIVLVIVMIFLYHFLRKRIFLGKISRLPLRLVSLGLIFYLLSGIFTLFSEKEKGKIAEGVPVVSILNNFNDISWFGNTVNSQLRSLTFVWYKQVSTEVIEQPSGYSSARMRSIEQKYKELAETINKTRTESIGDQTVIYILSESFSNPNRVPNVNVEAPADIVPYIDSIKEQYTSGLMHSDGYGGGTANMEFQTLMGLPFYNLSPSVSTIYTEVVPKMDYLPSISNQFQSKNRIAIHLENDYNYSRNVIYQRLGFNQFINKKDSKKYDVENIGLYPSDKSTYDIVLKNIKDNQSQFFSVMTMQNHVPWRVSGPEDVKVHVDQFTDEENADLVYYSRLLTYTDSATREFLESLKTINKKITVVFYGDHLPGLYPSWMFEENPDSQYRTDYFIWSNFQTPKLDYPLVNSSDFTAELLEHTNSKVSPYYALLTQVLKEASVGDRDNLTPEGEKIAEDLKLVQYDLIGGDGYLANSNFFKINK